MLSKDGILIFVMMMIKVFIQSSVSDLSGMVRITSEEKRYLYQLFYNYSGFNMFKYLAEHRSSGRKSGQLDRRI